MPKMPTRLRTQHFTNSKVSGLGTNIANYEAGNIARLYQSGKFPDCLHTSKKFLKKFPDHKNVLMIAGAACMALCDYNGAQKYFHHLHRKFPTDADVLNNLGTAYFNAEKFAQSIDCYKKAYNLGKRNPNFYTNYSNALRTIGEFTASNRLLREAISQHPNNALVFIAASHSFIDIGDVHAAVDTARRATKLDPKSAKSHAAMGAAHAASKDFEAALSHYETATSLPTATEKEHYSHGAVLGELGQFEAALSATRDALRKNPRSEKSLLNAGWFSYKLGHFDEAIVEYSKALTVNPSSSEAFSGLATVYSAVGDHVKAVEFFKHAHTHSPENPKVAFGLARALAAIGNELEAVTVFEQHVPFLENNDDLYDYAMCLESVGRPDEAINVFRRLASDGYKSTSVAEHLFNAFELKSQLDKAEIALEPLRECPEAQNIVAFFEGILFFRQKQYTLAAERLGVVVTSALSKHSQKRYFQVLGEVFDKLNRPDAAMECFVEMNELFLSDKPDPSVMALELLGRLDRDLSKSEQIAPSHICPTLNVSDDLKIGFIVGFPRSGTTLLDTVLRTHSRILVIEERPMLSHAMSVTLGGGTNSEDGGGFSDFDEEQLSRCREVYLRNLKTELGDCDTNGQLIFDKLPLHILRLPLIHAMFPDAPIIFAARHPFDSILSNFMQNFRINPSMACMLKLETACALYDRSLSILERTINNANVNIALYRYESIVADFETEVKQLLDCIGLTWENSLTDYRSTALSRKKINTPSYRQVTQPIYKESAYRWERYSKYLLPHSEVVQPYIDKLGYNPDYSGPLYPFVTSTVPT